MGEPISWLSAFTTGETVKEEKVLVTTENAVREESLGSVREGGCVVDKECGRVLVCLCECQTERKHV